MSIVIIDYGMGNLYSVQKAFNKLGIATIISGDIKQIQNANKLILPGVGHFKNGVRNLKDSGIWDVINEKVLKDKIKILGICLGLQLMCSHSEEGDMTGLGWFDADIVKFKVGNALKYKVPHMGWNTIIKEKDDAIIESITNDSEFYFVHSYYVKSHDSRDILTTTCFESSFASSLVKDNIYGFQFHPEKSHNSGAQLLRNFANK